MEKSNSRISDVKTKRYGGVKALSHCLTPLVEPICKKQGFMSASIILDWPKIVGEKFAEFCHATKVTFPFSSRKDGCLHITTTSSMAAILAYEEPLIIEKINRYYGYQAVSKLKIFHGLKVERKTNRFKEKENIVEQNISFNLDGIPHEHLKEALTILGQHIYACPKK